MPGQFSIDARPVLPGAYVNFVAAQQAVVPVSVGSLVAIPFTHDWGPLEIAVQVNSLADFQRVYGATNTSPGYYAVQQAFKGEGVAGRGGAGAVLAYRMGSSAAAKATKTLQNTTPATALTLSARYQGAKGNLLTVTTQDYASDATKTELIVYLSGSEVERHRFLDADINDAAARINANSQWLTAVANISGVALGIVSNQALTAGNDGSTLIAQDWTDMMTAMGVFRFGILAPYDLTDIPITASLRTWAEGLNAQGKRFFTVVGGLTDELITTAKTRAAALASYNFSTVGVGSVRDNSLFDTSGIAKILSTAQFGPRIAGALAGRGERMSLTYARFSDIELLNGATVAQIADAYDNGVMVLEQDSNQNPVRINQARTAYVTAIDGNHPVNIFYEPKFVRTMQIFEMEITENAEANYIGQVPVNSATAESIIGDAKSRMQSRAEASIIQEDWLVRRAANPPVQDTDDFIHIEYGMKFGRSLKMLLNTITVG